MSHLKLFGHRAMAGDDDRYQDIVHRRTMSAPLGPDGAHNTKAIWHWPHLGGSGVMLRQSPDQGGQVDSSAVTRYGAGP